MSPTRLHTILLVEDEPVVRSFMADALRLAGFLVVAVPDAEAGWEFAERDLDGVDAVVTDVRLPGMSGPALLRRLRALRPDLPALYVTGYAGDVLVPGSGDEAPCLPKPFRATDFINTVRGLLLDPRTQEDPGHG